MKKIMQHKNECTLAAMCYAHGVDYETASDLFRLDNGLAWGDSFIIAFRPIRAQWCRGYGMPLPIVSVMNNVDAGTNDDSDARLSTGKWYVTFRMCRVGDGPSWRHIVVVDNGLVMDWYGETPLPLAAYLAHTRENGYEIVIDGIERIQE